MVGGATPLLIPLLWLLKTLIGFDSAELAVGFLMFHAAHLINDPHFSATYLLFYRNIRERAFGHTQASAQRVRYLGAAFLVPLLLGIWAAAALSEGSSRTLGWMIQLMFFLVGWHYVKQGFGVLSVLSARRGISWTAHERRALLAHCIFGWLYSRASPADPGTGSEEKGVLYTSFTHPPGLEALTLGLFALSTAWLGYVLVAKWRRERRLPMAPLLGLLVSVWIWVVFSDIDPLLIYMIPALHSLQYLYFVGLLTSNQARAEEQPPLFKRAARTRLSVFLLGSLALGWALFHGLPDLLDTALISRHTAHSALGPTPYFAALFTFVNIHHYFMDSVIWRRDNPETRFLVNAAALRQEAH